MTEDEIVGWYHQLNGHEFEKLQEIVKKKEAWSAAVHGVTKSQTPFSDRTTTKIFPCPIFPLLSSLWMKILS